MLETFLKGLVFGAGFTIALMGVSTVWFLWVMPQFDDMVYSSSYVLDEDVEWVKQSSKDVAGSSDARMVDDEDVWMPGVFPGASTVRSFDFQGAETLDSGPGQLVGRVMAEGDPVAGMRFRLALDRHHWSPWTTTDEDGTYLIELPYGAYRVDGYDLDPRGKVRQLGGLVASPSNDFPDEQILVDESGPATGPELVFVSPVELVAPPETMSIDQPLVLAWKPYTSIGSINPLFTEFQQYPEPSPAGV